MILTDFKNSFEHGDVKLNLVGRDGYRVTMDVHKKVLSEKSKFFREKMKSRRENGVSNSQMVEISECGDVDVYVETVVLMYCDDLQKKLAGLSVIKVLTFLKVSSAITFLEGRKSVLGVLRGSSWCLVLKNLTFLTATSVLHRVSSFEPSTSTSITDNIFLKLLTGIIKHAEK